MERKFFQRIGGTRGRGAFNVLAMSAAAAVVLGACSDGSESGSARLGTARTTTSTTSTPETSSTTARAGQGTTATTRVTTPPQQGGAPKVIASPAGAAPETRVSITGTGFTAENWRAPNVPLWLAGGPSGCDFYADADHDVRVNAAGVLSGSFVVPSHGVCRQSSTGDLPMRAGRYRIVYQCTACTIGEFEVTADAPAAMTRCEGLVGFSPNSDNVAADIVAYGLSCDEARTVVRNVGGPLGPINGSPRGEADGFTCVRTSQSEGRGLPSSTYDCTRGSQRITFTRL